MAEKIEQFLKWWMASRQLNVPFERPLQFRDQIIGAVLYRSKPWQVQLFNVLPNSVIPQHRHPNVDSFEVYLGGDIQFSLDGRDVTFPQMEADFNGRHPHFGQVMRVRPMTWHGAAVGRGGGAFLSVQQWLNGIEPTTVGDDWEPEVGNSIEDRSHAAPLSATTPALEAPAVIADARDALDADFQVVQP